MVALDVRCLAVLALSGCDSVFPRPEEPGELGAQGKQVTLQ